MTPFCDARPTCSGFVMLPKLTRMPEAELAAIASMCAVWLASRPSSFAAADGRAERADGARRVEALLVVIRVNRLGDLALDLEAREERLEELRAARCAAARRRRARRRAAAWSGASAGRRCGPALVASCVSSQSSAWPLVPLTSAADGRAGLERLRAEHGGGRRADRRPARARGGCGPRPASSPRA